MKSKDTEIRQLNELQSEDKERLEYVVKEIKDFIYSGHITPTTVKRLTTLIQVLAHMRNEHSDYLFKWLKQGYLVED